MKDLYKLANAFLKASQEGPQVSQEFGPPSAGLKSEAPKPSLQKIDKNIQYLLNQLHYPGALSDTGVLDENTKAAIGWFRQKFNYQPGGNLLQQLTDEVSKSSPSAHELAGNSYSAPTKPSIGDIKANAPQSAGNQREVLGPKA